MDYIESSLQPEEQIIFATRPHWVIFSSAGVGFVIAYLLLWLLPSVSVNLPSFFSLIPHFTAFIAFFIVFILFIRALIAYKTTEYGLTNRRVLMKTGWIQRNSLDIFLNRIEAVQVEQSIPGRFLNYGTLVIVGTGGTKDPFLYVPDPFNFQKKIQQQVSDFQKKSGSNE